MSAWLQRQATSHKAQLAGAAVLSGAAIAGAIFGYQAIKRQAAIKELKSSIPHIGDQYEAQKVWRPLSSIFFYSDYFSSTLSACG
jgi:hypothetical protein